MHRHIHLQTKRTRTSKNSQTHLKAEWINKQEATPNEEKS